VINILSTEQLQRYTPSAFAVAPWQAMSTRYRMIPTIQVIDHLRQHGFLPVSAQQGRTRIPGKQDFTRHVIRFINQDWSTVKVGDVIPQMVLSNSHDGTSAYKILLGMFRVACTNGLMVHSNDINEISVRHSGPETLADDVLEASYEVIEQTPKAVAQIEDWSRRDLNTDQKMAFAEAALELHESVLKPSTEQVLRVRRNADAGNDIWRTMNTVQENLIRGGQLTRNATGQRRHVRAIKSLNEDVRLNRALWKLTEALASHV
jgi:Domain of unknown function (DUF932)